MTDQIQVWLIDDDEGFRLTAAEHLTRNPRVANVSTFSRCEPAIQILEDGANPPDVMFLDLMLPGVGGLHAMPKITILAPEMPIVVVTGYASDENIRRAISLGASGFLSKDSMRPEDFAGAVQDVSNKGMSFDSGVARRLIQMSGLNAEGSHIGYLLTEREQGIIARLREGSGIKQITDELHVTANTVHTHLENIYRKLDVHSRTELLSKVFRERLP
jgi:DNA-binding NarL/FixJ family response regulator